MESMRMRQIDKNVIAQQILWIVVLALSLPWHAFADAGANDRDVWNGYSASQKKVSIAGFVHGYRAGVSRNDAFAQTDTTAAVQTVDQSATGGTGRMLGKLILEALKKAPSREPDAHADRKNRPYENATGTWWRGAKDKERRAYVQGVFWSAEIAPRVVVRVPEKSVDETVKKLNGWYQVWDEDWKDPRSDQRVNVAVLVAMQQTGIISIKKARARTPR
jgi:hypothetical protein